MKEVLLADLLSGALSRESADPLQKQIYDIVRRGVLDHTLVAGQRLPSSRVLAQELGISRITVTLAYERLIAENYLSARGGSGTFVEKTVDRPLLPPASPEHVQRHVPGLSTRGEGIAGGAAGLGQHTGAFVPGVADASLFPFHLWRRLVSRHLGKSNLALSGYAKDGAGFLPLREAIASYLKASRGVRCDIEQVVIVSGSQQALDLTTRILLDPGDAVCIEDPGYLGARHAFTGAGAQLIPIAIDDEGLQIATAMEHKQDIRLVYATPSHQYPMGVTMSLTRRLALLEWATRKGMWIVEDDYDSEYRYTGRPLATLQGLDHTGRVIYMGTFSKVLLPSLRLGYLVVPPALVETFVQARSLADRHSPSMDQAILAQFINEGHFTRHIRRMKKLYMERQALLMEAARRELHGALDIPPTPAGLHVVGRLDPKLKDRDVSQLAQQLGVDTPPLSAYCLQHSPLNGLVLGYAGIAPEDIQTGMQHLARAIRLVASA